MVSPIGSRANPTPLLNTPAAAPRRSAEGPSLAVNASRWVNLPGTHRPPAPPAGPQGRTAPTLQARLEACGTAGEVLALLGGVPGQACAELTELSLNIAAPSDLLTDEALCCALRRQCPQLQALRLPLMARRHSAMGQLASMACLRALHLYSDGSGEACEEAVAQAALLPRLQTFACA